LKIKAYKSVQLFLITGLFRAKSMPVVVPKVAHNTFAFLPVFMLPEGL